jgi:hypothetical protein
MNLFLIDEGSVEISDMSRQEFQDWLDADGKNQIVGAVEIADSPLTQALVALCEDPGFSMKIREILTAANKLRPE